MKGIGSPTPKDRAIHRVAYILKSWFDEDRDHFNTRLLDIRMLIPDQLVLAGVSKRGSDRREHVVPLRVLCDEAFKMFKAGSDVDDVESFLTRCLWIVHVSKEEADLLDLKNGLNLRQKMPDGWHRQDGDPFARLRCAGIETIEPLPEVSSGVPN